MNIDVSKLNAAELDDLIAKAAKRRINLSPSIPIKWPEGNVNAIVDPSFALTPNPQGTLIQIRDPGCGWLSYVATPETRANLIGILMQHALFNPFNKNDSATAATTSTGGGAIH